MKLTLVSFNTSPFVILLNKNVPNTLNMNIIRNISANIFIIAGIINIVVYIKLFNPLNDLINLNTLVTLNTLNI